MLNSFSFFYIYIYTAIFDIVDVLFGILKSKTLDVQFSLARITDFCQSTERERTKFNDIFEKTTLAVGQPSTPHRKPDARSLYRELHEAVIDNMLAQNRDRFKDHKRRMIAGFE